jgi:transposase
MVTASKNISAKKEKVKYRVSNWSEYNSALKERGNIAIWVHKGVLSNWYVDYKDKPKQRGRNEKYSEAAIRTCCYLRQLFNLPYRQLEGFVNGIFEMQNIDLEAPDYTCISRRSRTIKISLKNQKKIEQIMRSGQRVCIAIDASGLKVYGEGEWKVRQHKAGKRRTWTKLHVAIDADTQDIVAIKVTNRDTHDGSCFKDLIEQIPNKELIKEVYADGAYTWNEHYDYSKKNKIKLFSPLPKNATLSGKDDEVFKATARDLALVEQDECGGTEQWKKETTYHRRSLVECTFSRIKRIFGDRLRARNIKTQTSVPDSNKFQSFWKRGFIDDSKYYLSNNISVYFC